VLFGTVLAAVLHRGAAPTVSQLVFVGGGEPALFANPVISKALFFGSDSDSDLDSFGAQLVKRVAEIVAHGVHDRDGLLRCFVIAPCVSKLRRRAWESGSTEGGGFSPQEGPWKEPEKEMPIDKGPKNPLLKDLVD
jgi:hypothetical protein